jgi:hypothetical protein
LQIVKPLAIVVTAWRRFTLNKLAINGLKISKASTFFQTLNSPFSIPIKCLVPKRLPVDARLVEELDPGKNTSEFKRNCYA